MRFAGALLLGLFVAVPMSAADSGSHDSDHEQRSQQLIEANQRLAARDSYLKVCANCHGERGSGAGGDFGSPEAVARMSRDAMIDMVRQGHDKAAPAADLKGLSEQETAAIVDYIREALMLPAPVADASKGRQIYSRTCSVCHGEHGDAASWARNSLNPPPLDFTSDEARKLTREFMIHAVTYGVRGTAMMPFTTQLSPEDIGAVVDYIRGIFIGPLATQSAHLEGHHDHDEAATEQESHEHEQHEQHEHHEHGPVGDPNAPFASGLIGDYQAGKQIFDDNCAECHGLQGKGDGRRAYFMLKKPRDFTAAAARAELNRPHLFASIAQGVLRSEMSAWAKVLSDQQIADVAEYVFRAFLRPQPGAAQPQKSGLLQWKPSDHGQTHQAALALGCGSLETERLQAGRAVYNRYCYFCHGYSGNARTVAAHHLDPPPKDFTASTDLPSRQIRQAIREGRAKTGMQGFAGILADADIEAVADFIEEEFIRCNAENSRYHTAENGWPEHEQRHKDAIPFVTGQLAFDAPLATMTGGQQAGVKLFLEGCISCHEGRRAGSSGPLDLAEQDDEDYHRPGNDQAAGAHDHEGQPVLATGLDGETDRGLGAELFRQNCALCHADDGSGDNWIGRFLQPSPPSFADATIRQRLLAAPLAERILAGVPDSSMPSFRSVLSLSQAEAIATYMKQTLLR